MNRLAKSALGLTGALALSIGGMSTASATEKDNQELTKEVLPWVYYKETTVFPAGSACKDKVEAKENAKFRDILYKDKKGKVVKVYSEFADWSTVKFSSTTIKKHHDGKKHKKVTKSIKLNQGGDAWIYNKKGDFDVAKVEAEGANWGQGAGVYGILWSKGDISYTVVNANTEPRIVKLDLSEAKKVLQVCYKLGSKPVNGKNVPPPAPAEEPKA